MMRGASKSNNSIYTRGILIILILLFLWAQWPSGSTDRSNTELNNQNEERYEANGEEVEVVFRPKKVKRRVEKHEVVQVIEKQVQYKQKERRYVSYSFYIGPGDPFFWFFPGLLHIVDQLQYFLPTWKVRLYSSDTLNSTYVGFLKSKGVEVVLKKFDTSKPLSAMFWRFLIADDPTVDRYIVRDLDSRWTIREVHAIQEWIESGKKGSTMRDHVYHNVPMLGGMWGGKRGLIDDLSMQQLIDQYPGQHVKGQDQSFLGSKIWPLIKKDTMSHDADLKRGFCYDAPCTPFPSPLRQDQKSQFIGCIFYPDSYLGSDCVMNYTSPVLKEFRSQYPGIKF